MQPAHIQHITPISAETVFRADIIATPNPRTAASLRQALGSFERFLAPAPLTFDDFTTTRLSAWLGALFAAGYTPKTAAYYLKNLSALYNKAVARGLARETDAFTQLRLRLQSSANTAYDHISDPDIIKKTQLLAAKSAQPGGSSLADDLTVFAILAGGLSPDSLAHLKTGDPIPPFPLLSKIAAKYTSPKRKYLFPLHQSELTPRRLERLVASLVGKALRDVKIKIPADTTDLPAVVWSALAREICSLAPGAIVACLGRRPDRSPAYDFAPATALADIEIEFIREEISAAVTDNPARWFAMRLRPATTYEKLTERLALSQTPAPELYYPSEEIARRSGRRIIYENKPVIPGLIFFRTVITAIPALFRIIGDLAWCYRSGAGYAVIPNTEMELFRRAIGSIGPDTDLHPLGTIPLEKGDRVEIIGGSFIGREATFTSTHTPAAGPNAGKTVYRLTLLDNNGIEWTVDTPPSLVRKTD